jgi:hypothetical protein
MIEKTGKEEYPHYTGAIPRSRGRIKENDYHCLPNRFHPAGYHSTLQLKFFL